MHITMRKFYYLTRAVTQDRIIQSTEDDPTLQRTIILAGDPGNNPSCVMSRISDAHIDRVNWVALTRGVTQERIIQHPAKTTQRPSN